MEKLKEENKILLNKRTSLINIMIILTGGILGLIVSDMNSLKIYILLLIGIYFDILFLCNILSIDNKLKQNLKEL